ncbi:MAG: YfiR family protein [Mariprofundus sp.]|nr:YfiR family protein [Mariprofundus sp.]
MRLFLKNSYRILCGCLLALLLSLHPIGSSIAAEKNRAGISDLKAVYVFNFIRFTEWPTSNVHRKGISINVLSEEDVYDRLKSIIAKPVAKDLGLSVQSCKQDRCIHNSSVLFIGESGRQHFKQLLKQLEGEAVLTISDIPGFAEQGGMVEIKYHNKKLTFVVNLQAVKRAGFYISAQLLQLGEIVGRDNE